MQWQTTSSITAATQQQHSKLGNDEHGLLREQACRATGFAIHLLHETMHCFGHQVACAGPDPTPYLLDMVSRALRFRLARLPGNSRITAAAVGEEAAALSPAAAAALLW
jgi:hypothetical protein